MAPSSIGYDVTVTAVTPLPNGNYRLDLRGDDEYFLLDMEPLAFCALADTIPVNVLVDEEAYRALKGETVRLNINYLAGTTLNGIDAFQLWED